MTKKKVFYTIDSSSRSIGALNRINFNTRDPSYKTFWAGTLKFGIIIKTAYLIFYSVNSYFDKLHHRQLWRHIHRQSARVNASLGFKILIPKRAFTRAIMGNHLDDPIPNGDCPVLYTFGSVSLLSSIVSDHIRKKLITKLLILKL